MTAVDSRPQTAAPASLGVRGQCVACCRPYGLPRSPAAEPPGSLTLLACPPLVVCDPCWHLAGGRRGVADRLLDVDEASASDDAAALAPVLVFDPAVAALLEAAGRYDELHPIDRLLVESGVRWALVRRIVVPSRMKLAGDVLCRVPPADTRPADSPDVWLDAVKERIDAQTGSRGGKSATFKYRPKRKRWAAVAKLFATAAHRDRRPLTWLTQDEIAAVVSCTDRTVRRIVRWLCKEGLLWEVVPGCQLPEQEVPDGETPAEAAGRRAEDAGRDRRGGVCGGPGPRRARCGPVRAVRCRRGGRGRAARPPGRR